MRSLLVVIFAGLLVAGFSVFGQWRYDWVRHDATWGPPLGTPWFALPVLLVGAFFAIVLQQRRRANGLADLNRAMTPLLAAVPLIALSFLLDGAWPQKTAAMPPFGAWILYGWMGLVILCGWRVARLAERPEISRRTLGWLVVGGAASACTMLVWMQVHLWHGLSFGYHDIGLFARALHSAAEGRGLWVDSLGRSILGEHAGFALWALVPVVALGVSAFELLMLVAPLCLNAPAFIIAWYVRRQTQSNFVAALAAGAWLLLPFHGCLVIAAGYGFHEIYLAVPLLVGGLALSGLRRWRDATLCMIAVLTVREDLALTVAAWGLYLAVFQRRRAHGLAVAGVALAWFWLAVAYVVPAYRGGPYPHMAFHFADGVSGLLSVDGLRINVSFLLTILLPLAMLPLADWRLALVAVPALAETVLTTNPDLHNLSFHYYTAAVPVLFFAAWPRWLGFHRLAVALVVAACVGQTYLGIGPLSNNAAAPVESPAFQAQYEKIRQVRALLPPHASVTASYRLAAHFTDAHRLWTVANPLLGDVIVIDDRDDWDGSRPREALIRAHSSGGYQPTYADYHLVVLIRDAAPTPLAEELRPGVVSPDMPRLQLSISEEIELAAMRIEPPDTMQEPEPTFARVTLIWRCLESPRNDLRFVLALPDGEKQWGPFYFARGAYPTPTWRPGELYRDDLIVSVPAARVPDLDRLRPTVVRH